MYTLLFYIILSPKFFGSDRTTHTHTDIYIYIAYQWSTKQKSGLTRSPIYAFILHTEADFCKIGSRATTGHSDVVIVRTSAVIIIQRPCTRG